MTIRLHGIDFETRSPVDLRVAGVARYAEHPDTDVWCMAYETTEGVKVWQREDVALPDELYTAIEQGGFLRAWNANFERTIWREIMVKRYGWPALPTDRFVCAMAMAAAASLPLSLDKAAIALRLREQKDLEGYKLMLRMSRPRSRNADGTYVWWDEPEKRARLSAYCAQDVRTEGEAWSKLPPSMNGRERKIWLMDQRINDRGIALDLPLIHAAHRLIATVQPKLDAQLDDLTGGIKVTQVAQLKGWLEAQGLPMDSLNKAAVTEALAGHHISPEVREVLEARQGGAKSSTSKYGAMLAAVCADGRVRGTMQYYGATTGRWAGRGIQPHNNPTPQRAITAAHLDDIRTGSLEYLEALHGPILPLLSDTLRSCFVAAPGKRLAVADYSTIEARIVAWLAGQDDLVDAFRSGAKLYEEMGAMAHGVELSELLDYKQRTGKHHPFRQDGKIGILGCGFGMGPKRASEQYGIERKLAATIVKLYRDRYPSIVEHWGYMNRAANEAVLTQTEVEVPNTFGRLRFEARGGYLLLHLPSGRPLWYHAPVVRTYMVQRKDIEIDPVTGEEREIDISFEATGTEVSTLHGVTKQWVRQQMYGGLWTENAVQACARDIMADAMLRCEDAAVPVVLSVHDEIVAEVEPTVTVPEFVGLLTTLPLWATGCPIAAEGWIEERYRK